MEYAKLIEKVFGRSAKQRNGETKIVSEYKTLRKEIEVIGAVRQLKQQEGWRLLMKAVKGKINEITDELEELYRKPKPPIKIIHALLAKRDAFLEFVDIVDTTIEQEPAIRAKLEALEGIINEANLDQTRQSLGEPLIDVGAL